MKKNAIKVLCFVVAVLVIGISSVYIYFTWDVGEFDVIDGSERGTVIITNYKGSSKEIIIPKRLRGKKVISIDDTAFKGQDITSVVIGDNIKSIGNNVFQNCEKLRSVDMGTALESIGDMSFAGCTSLESVKFSPVLKDMGHMTFGNIETDVKLDINGNQNFAVDNGVIYSSDYKIVYESLISADLSSYKLPETVIELRPYAFYSQAEMGNIALNDGITTIPEGCFISCEGMTELVIPDSVTSIATVVLAGSNIEKITIPASVQKIDQYAFIKDGSEVNLGNKTDEEDAEENSEKSITIVTTNGSFASTFARRNNFKLEITDVK